MLNYLFQYVKLFFIINDDTKSFNEDSVEPHNYGKTAKMVTPNGTKKGSKKEELVLDYNCAPATWSPIYTISKWEDTQGITNLTIMVLLPLGINKAQYSQMTMKKDEKSLTITVSWAKKLLICLKYMVHLRMIMVSIFITMNIPKIMAMNCVVRVLQNFSQKKL